MDAGQNLQYLPLRGAIREPKWMLAYFFYSQTFQETRTKTWHATNLPRRSLETGNCPILCVKITLSFTVSLNQDKNRNSISEQAHLPGHDNHMSDPISKSRLHIMGRKGQP